MIIGTLLFVILIQSTHGQFLNFPSELVQDVTNLMLGVIDVVVPTCVEVKPNEIIYLYYNRENPIEPILLNATNFKENIIRAPIKVYIHGWLSSGTDLYSNMLKDAYIKRGNYNIIIVDWEKYANINYAQSICSLKFIAKTVGNFFYKINHVGKIDLSFFHLIGHSLGAHLAGYIGKHVQRRSGGQKLYRITGLDAAGPGFFGFPKDSRLDASDALFVDAIHTNGAQFGYPINYGSVDFYPNCGLFQPGCLSFNINFNRTLIREATHTIACSHLKSIEFFAESINSREFLGVSFRFCFLFYKCSKTITKETSMIMGEDVPLNAHDSYCLDTHSQAPFARGLN